MSKIYREQAIGLARELKLTEDGIRGTMGWIEPKVKPDVYEKMLAVCQQSVRFGVMKAITNSERFRDGIEEELDD